LFPEILEIGSFHLRSYGLLLAIGFLAGTWLGLKQGRGVGLDADRLLNLIFTVLVSGVLGSRLFFVLGHLDYFGNHPLESLYIWRGGLTLWGGFIVAVPIGILYTKRHGMDTWRVADVLAAPLALGATIGRLGCFLNGCCYGVPTTAPWGVVFPEHSEAAIHYGQQALHPSQLYNVVAGLVVFAITLVSVRFLRAPGQRFWLMLGLYALLRGLIDWTRRYEDSAVMLSWSGGQFTESQAISLGITVVSLAAFVWLGRRYATRAGSRT
jgi:phosphatidylglycerol:prolipoprotein diacylglycerol transferase